MAYQGATQCKQKQPYQRINRMNRPRSNLSYESVAGLRSLCERGGGLAIDESLVEISRTTSSDVWSLQTSMISWLEWSSTRCMHHCNIHLFIFSSGNWTYHEHILFIPKKSWSKNAWLNIQIIAWLGEWPASQLTQECRRPVRKVHTWELINGSNRF